jgi:threonine synthase
VAVSKARELGIHHLVIPSAGNAGGALAAYAARSGLSSTVVMPEDTPRANIDECRCAGAEVILVTGLITDCGKLAQELAEKDGALSLATFREPYRLEGKKTIGFELAESFNWELPEVIIFPTGGGTGLVGMWKAFQELKELGWLEKSTMPRMVAVQSSGCAPIVEAFRSGKSNCVFWPHAQTIATGLKVPLSFADKIILRVIHESNGEAVAVEDESIRKAQLNLVKEEGIHASPEGAATLAGLIRVISAKDDARNGRIVIFNTASGLKYLG